MTQPLMALFGDLMALVHDRVMSASQGYSDSCSCRHRIHAEKGSTSKQGMAE